MIRCISKRSWRFLWIVSLALFPGPAGLAASQQTALVFGIGPHRSAVDLARQWLPLLAYLEKETDLTLAFETATDIPTFEVRLDAGRYDIVYCNPADYVQRSIASGYRAFARESGERLQGLVVVPSSSPVRTLDDLAGATLAFPAPRAFAAAMLPLAEFKARGIAVTPAYVSTHDSVYLAVARGFYPAGGGIRRAYDKSPEEIRQALRILWESPPYTPHPLAAHSRVPAAAVARLRAALVAMADSPQGRDVLTRMQFRGFEAGEDADWNDVRRLLGLPPAAGDRTGLP
ncbi:Phosphonate ABC transporter phosphate-binding periplasmic component [Desulfovibrio sp. DV]|uniref:phosphate/phosphite/phosphonate ABC transporter substrate-binding protein n=1 Tax=Desulfovibrio sp. DV TaxID=1844708 RepID=UPI00094B85AE|nr:phosphate/phosphite/phosphonate ABC transporter substrate-binding protein [Desulfovibrio sp. DV]OLN29751.1 Phosphonate ABC transporter phosphate-binding periplasmic component [Desulfovibrio sp. DV]